MNDDRSVSQTHAAAAHSPATPFSQHPTHPAPSLQPTQLPFGTHLEPALQEACDGRLSHVNWFRTDWQRGGALTGYATYCDETGEHAVVVKMPVPPRERRWLTLLQETEVAPRVHRHGESLGGYDFCWVVMERFAHGPIGHAWGGKGFELVIDAVVRFSAAARHIEPDGPRRHHDYEAIHHQARENIHRHGVAQEQRWNKALKAAHRMLKDWLAVWDTRPVKEWCHGDLHLGNAMTRTPPPSGPAFLLDFAEVHCGHWIEDAVHLEHLYWGRRDKLEGHRICKEIARARKALHLPVDEDWPRLAQIHRALLAMSTPAVLRFAGDPHHVQAALEVLEAEVG